MTIDDELLDSAGAALFLKISERTLERWRRNRTGPSYVRLSARAVRYRVADLRRFRDGHTIECEG
jgi:hypothetical protein